MSNSPPSPSSTTLTLVPHCLPQLQQTHTHLNHQSWYNLHSLKTNRKNQRVSRIRCKNPHRANAVCNKSYTTYISIPNWASFFFLLLGIEKEMCSQGKANQGEKIDGRVVLKKWWKWCGEVWWFFFICKSRFAVWKIFRRWTAFIKKNIYL